MVRLVRKRGLGGAAEGRVRRPSLLAAELLCVVRQRFIGEHQPQGSPMGDHGEDRPELLGRGVSEAG